MMNALPCLAPVIAASTRLLKDVVGLGTSVMAPALGTDTTKDKEDEPLHPLSVEMKKCILKRSCSESQQ